MCQQQEQQHSLYVDHSFATGTDATFSCLHKVCGNTQCCRHLSLCIVQPRFFNCLSLFCIFLGNIHMKLVPIQLGLGWYTMVTAGRPRHFLPPPLLPSSWEACSIVPKSRLTISLSSHGMYVCRPQ